MPSTWQSSGLDGWVAVRRYDDSTTGFGATLYRKANADGSSDYIVAMQGTRGRNLQDWGGNLIYGWDKWISPEGGQALLAEILALDDVNKIHFTGQSLGGALAQYALYEYALGKEEFSASKATLTTFNGLGGLEALRTKRGFDPSLASPVTQVDTAHFYITNDLASRLGGGHLNGNVNGSVNEYELSFSQVGDNGLPRRRDDSSTVALDFVTAHRIESGFYAGFNRVFGIGDPLWPADFVGAKAKPIQLLNVGGLARTGTYIAWLTNQDGALTTSEEALARTAAALTYALAYGNQDEIRTLSNAFFDNIYASSESVGRPFIPALKRLTPNFLTLFARSPSGIAAHAAGQFLALSVEAGGETGEVTAGSDFVQRFAQLIDGAGATTGAGVDPRQIRDALNQRISAASGGAKLDALYVGSAALFAASAVLAVPSLVDSARNAAVLAILEFAVESARDFATFARLVALKAAQAIQRVASDASEAIAEVAAEVARALIAAAIDVSRGVTDFIADTKQFVSDIEASVAEGVAEVGRSIANAHEDLVLKFSDAFEWGVPVARETLESIRRFLVREADADPSGTGPSFEEAIKALTFAAQLVVARPGRGPNPFDEIGFDPEAAPIPTDVLREGSIGDFTVYLPYEADEGGQRITLEILGAVGDEISVLTGGEEVTLGPDGTFTITVAEGQREATFAIVAGADLDADQVVSLSATLTNASGEPTHQRHDEATLTLDGETESAPAGGREIRGDWAPKEYTDPNTGEIYYAYDDLGNIEREPGKPNDQNFREPDASFTGSAGADHIVAADSADTVYAHGGDDAITAGDVFGNIIRAGPGDDWVEAGRYELHEVNYIELERWGRVVRHGEDKIYGGAGDDRLYGEYEATVNALYDPSVAPTGRPGDWIGGGSGNDKAFGGAGDDVLMGGLGEDMLTGGAGMDVLLGDDNFGIAMEGVFWTVLHPNFGASGPGFGNFELGLFPVYNYYPNINPPTDIDPNDGDPYVSYYKEGGGADVLNGGAGKDILIGQLGDDILYGGEDDDILAGWEGADQIFGGAGDDLMAGELGRYELPAQRLLTQIELAMPGLVGAPGFDASVVEQIGNDLLDGGGGNDVIFGEGGDDVVLGGEGSDTLYGDASYLPAGLHGNDLLDGGAGDDVLEGGGGNDKLYGGDGDDTLSGSLGNDLLEGGAGNDALDGGEGDDTLRGGEGADVLAGAAGTDELRGGAGDDRLEGGEDGDILQGEAGADQLAGGAGNDLLYGGSGEDLLEGGEGDDFLDSGAGIDIVRGGAGNDTYAIGYGYGNDIIEDAEGENRLRFGAGILPEDLSAVLDSESLAATLTFGAAGDSLSFDAGELQLGGVEFSSGMSWDNAEFVAFMPAVVSQGSAAGEVLIGNERLRNDLRGGAGNDRLEGASFADTLAGGEGSDALDGKGGSDRYVFAADETGVDALSDSGLAAHAYLDWFYGSRGIGDWEERGAHGGAYRAEGAGEGGQFVEYFDTYEAAYDLYPFATITYVEPLPEIAPVISRNDAEALAALTAEGVLDNDRVEFGPGLTLADLELRVRVDAATAGEHPEQPWYGGGTLSVRWDRGGFDVAVPDVDFGFAGASLLEEGALESYRLGEGIESFRFADGSVVSLEEMLQQAEVIELREYVVARGSGAHELDIAVYDAVRFEDRIDADEVAISRDGLDLRLELADASASVRVADWFADPPQVPDVSALFAADPVLSAGELTRIALTQQGTELDDWLDSVDGFSNVLYGNGGRDILQGGSGDDLLDGGAGDDSLYGAQGDDVYVFGPGYETDGVSEDEDDEGGGFDSVRLEPSLAPEDVSVERDSGDLLLSLNDGDDVFSVFSWFRETGGTVEEVEFADGTVWDAAALEAMLPPADAATEESDTLLGLTGDDVLSGLGGDDEIYGFAGADVLEGGGGYDYLEGGKGDDSYLVSLGTEGDEIYEDDGYDRVVFGGGIAPADVQLSDDGESLFLAVGSNGDSVTVWYWLSDATKRVEEFQFADGTTWDENKIWNRLLGVANQAPALEAPIADQSANEDAPFSFAVAEGAFSDPDAGDTLTYTAGELPAWLSFDAETRTFSGTPLQADVGASEVRVSATDSGGLYAEDTFTLTVANVNDAPVAAMPIADQFATEDAAFAFEVPAQTFFDEDPDDVIAWYASREDGSELPAWLSFDPASRTFSGVPENGGAFDVRVTVTDAAGLSASQTFALAIENVNDAPVVAVPIADQSFDAGTPFVFAVAPDTFADEDAGDTLTFTASLFGGGALPGWLSFDPASAAFTGSPAATDIGIFHLQVTAFDAAVASAVSDFGLVLRAPAGTSVAGGRGDDAIYGGTGDETLTARGGSDYLFGDPGDDLLRGGAGNDVLQGGEGADVLRGGRGQNVLDGGSGDDLIYGGRGSALIAGGAGNDTIRTGSGSDVILFNRGDGIDTLIGDRDGDNTLSFGGGIRYSDLSFSKEGRNLVVSAGEDDRVVLKNWYAGKQSISSLQIMLDASEDFDSGSADPLYNKRVQTFDFMGLVSAFDAARAETPGLTSWEVTNALLEFHLSAIDDMALGGDLAYWYGRDRSFAGISLAAAQQVIGAPGFGSDAQTLRPFSGLQEGFVKLS